MKTALVALVASATLIAAGCGSDEDMTDDSGAPKVPCSHQYSVDLRDGRGDVEVCEYKNPITGQTCTLSDGEKLGGHECQPLRSDDTANPDTNPESDS